MLLSLSFLQSIAQDNSNLSALQRVLERKHDGAKVYTCAAVLLPDHYNGAMFILSSKTPLLEELAVDLGFGGDQADPQHRTFLVALYIPNAAPSPSLRSPASTCATPSLTSHLSNRKHGSSPIISHVSRRPNTPSFRSPLTVDQGNLSPAAVSSLTRSQYHNCAAPSIPSNRVDVHEPRSRHLALDPSRKRLKINIDDHDAPSASNGAHRRDQDEKSLESRHGVYDSHSQKEHPEKHLRERMGSKAKDERSYKMNGNDIRHKGWRESERGVTEDREKIVQRYDRRERESDEIKSKFYATDRVPPSDTKYLQGDQGGYEFREQSRDIEGAVGAAKLNSRVDWNERGAHRQDAAIAEREEEGVLGTSSARMHAPSINRIHDSRHSDALVDEDIPSAQIINKDVTQGRHNAQITSVIPASALVCFEDEDDEDADDEIIDGTRAAIDSVFEGNGGMPAMQSSAGSSTGDPVDSRLMADRMELVKVKVAT